MAQETYIITYDRINWTGKRRTSSERKYEYRHAINAARSCVSYYGDWVIGWTITRKSDGVVLAQWGKS